MKKHNTSYSKLGDFAPKVTSPNKTLMALGVVAVITLGVLVVIGVGEAIVRVMM
jgi:hypothetical protein